MLIDCYCENLAVKAKTIKEHGLVKVRAGDINKAYVWTLMRLLSKVREGRAAGNSTDEQGIGR